MRPCLIHPHPRILLLLLPLLLLTLQLLTPPTLTREVAIIPTVLPLPIPFEIQALHTLPPIPILSPPNIIKLASTGPVPLFPPVFPARCLARAEVVAIEEAAAGCT